MLANRAIVDAVADALVETGDREPGRRSGAGVEARSRAPRRGRGRRAQRSGSFLSPCSSPREPPGGEALWRGSPSKAGRTCDARQTRYCRLGRSPLLVRGGHPEATDRRLRPARSRRRDRGWVEAEWIDHTPNTRHGVHLVRRDHVAPGYGEGARRRGPSREGLRHGVVRHSLAIGEDQTSGSAVVDPAQSA